MVDDRTLSHLGPVQGRICPFKRCSVAAAQVGSLSSSSLLLSRLAVVEGETTGAGLLGRALWVDGAAEVDAEGSRPVYGKNTKKNAGFT